MAIKNNYKQQHKVGDYVTIKEDLSRGGNYVFGLNETMKTLVGKHAKIVRVVDETSLPNLIEDVYFDGYEYFLDIDKVKNSWSSGMFEGAKVLNTKEKEKPTREYGDATYKVGDVVTIRADLENLKKKEIVFGVVNEMFKYAGKDATITKVEDRKHKETKDKTFDGYKYAIDLDEGCWSWSAGMLETQKPSKETTQENDTFADFFNEHNLKVFQHDHNLKVFQQRTKQDDTLETEEDISKKVTDELASKLIVGFTWRETSQGHDYWQLVDKLLRREKFDKVDKVCFAKVILNLKE